MEQTVYIQQSDPAQAHIQNKSNPLLEYGGKEAAILLASAIAISIILRSVKTLVQTVLSQKENKSDQ